MIRATWRWFTADPWVECPNCHLVQRASTMRHVIQPPDKVVHFCADKGECDKNKRDVAAEKRQLEDKVMLQNLKPLAMVH